jgi:3-oxoacyl-[acyl-carrier-protein] synthase-3
VVSGRDHGADSIGLGLVPRPQSPCREAVFKNLDRYGNTSGGSIPVAPDELYRAGGIRRGDLLLTSGFGAGLTWGTALWRW